MERLKVKGSVAGWPVPLGSAVAAKGDAGQDADKGAPVASEEREAQAPPSSAPAPEYALHPVMSLKEAEGPCASSLRTQQLFHF